VLENDKADAEQQNAINYEETTKEFKRSKRINLQFQMKKYCQDKFDRKT
jgi:hypothetical protein